MTNHERAKTIRISASNRDLSLLDFSYLEDLIVDALDEVEKRGRESQPDFETGYKRGHLDGRIYGQREMRERVVKEIQERLEDESLQGDIRGNLQSMHLGAMDAIEQILEIISTLPIETPGTIEGE